jgi:NAD(P)-dependent dehydrogenase (short-subunit alcohol dehydrogenase family)
MSPSAPLSGRVALVVGGTAGIGEAIAIELASRGASVTVSGRNAEAGAAVVARMREAAPSAEVELAFARLDASSLTETRSFAAERSAAYGDRPLDFLVMCQSTASFGGRQETSEGLELKLVLHCYSRFLLTELLLPSLRRAPNGRVLSVLSGGVHGPFTDWEDADLKANFSLRRAADAAGFYNDLALQHLANDPQNASIGFLHAAPGFVATKWGHQTRAAFLIKIAQWFATSADQCAQVMVGAMCDPRFERGFHCVSAKGRPAKTTSGHTPENIAALQAHLASLPSSVG